MNRVQERDRHALEIMLIVVCLGLTCLLYLMQGYKMVILNLYFLPVTLAGFFLGRYRAGVMALFCVIAASLVTVLHLTDLTTSASPPVIALAVVIWAAVLGLTSLLVGTLSDDRTVKLDELHEAYVGVVEVLSQYLQSAHPHLKARSIRVAELSQQVAIQMRLSPREIDDIRVAALLYDVGNIEVTTKVIRRAVGTFEDDMAGAATGTFQGMDLMLSLGSVLSGAMPLLLNQGDAVGNLHLGGQPDLTAEVPLGAQIIRTARAYCSMHRGAADEPRIESAEILARLRAAGETDHDANVLKALDTVVHDTTGTPIETPVG